MHSDILFKTIYSSNRIQLWIYQFGKFDNIKKCIYISFFSGRRQTILGNFKEEKFLEPILVDKKWNSIANELGNWNKNLKEKWNLIFCSTVSEGSLQVGQWKTWGGGPLASSTLILPKSCITPEVGKLRS